MSWGVDDATLRQTLFDNPAEPKGFGWEVFFSGSTQLSSSLRTLLTELRHGRTPYHTLETRGSRSLPRLDRRSAPDFVVRRIDDDRHPMMSGAILSFASVTIV